MGDLVARAVDSIHLFFVLYQLKYITHTPVHVVVYLSQCSAINAIERYQHSLIIVRLFIQIYTQHTWKQPKKQTYKKKKEFGERLLNIKFK